MTDRSPGLSILFADVCRSTELFEQLGDVRARNIIGDSLAAVAQIVERRGGTVIKSLGDELMCTFPSPALAAEAAIEMQREVPRPIPEVLGGLQLRIGFHHGEVLQEQGDIFGDAVNVAARLAGLAKAAQVLASSATIKAAGPVGKRTLGQVSLKGRQQSVAVSELLWQDDQSELTAIAGAISDQQLSAALRLELRFGDRQWEMTGLSFPTTIGRDPHNDLIVDQPSVSRHHATIEVRPGYFCLIDRSTNGTVVHVDGRRRQLLRDELRLEGSGQILLGTSTGHPIDFEIAHG